MSEIFSQLGYLLSYDAAQPLFFNSGLFLFLFLLFSGGYALLTGKHQTAVRLLYLTAFSYYFYYKNAGGYCVLLAIITLGNYFIGKMIEDAQDVKKKKILVSLAVTLMLSQLAYFKYTNFALSLVVPWAGGTFEPLDIFLPAGISFFTFQSMNYVIDVYRGKLKACRSLLDFSFFVSFFPTLLAGPILRARDFLPQVRQPLNVTREMFGLGLWFIMIGLFKKAIISDYIGVNFVNRIFDDPSLYTGLENLLGIYGYALKLYCDFSGYSDMAIGIALWLGFHIPANFRSPYKSQSITEFWRRWHISLSSWLRDYLYISLGGNRKGKVRMYVNLFLTMLLGGLWHGASLNFIVWGSIHGAALGVHKWFREKLHHGKEYVSTGWKKIAAVFLTFHLVCLCWLFFANATFDASLMMLTKIFTEFHGETIGQFLAGYPVVSTMIVAGFVLHFLPESWNTKVSDKIIKSPLWLQAAVFILLIILVVQVKSSDVQPFIYMQF
jgi:D-alanyl-lipoteichoic acid acyltransferase DltB (MBOAT superfamily)